MSDYMMGYADGEINTWRTALRWLEIEWRTKPLKEHFAKFKAWAEQDRRQAEYVHEANRKQRQEQKARDEAARKRGELLKEIVEKGT